MAAGAGAAAGAGSVAPVAAVAPLGEGEPGDAVPLTGDTLVEGSADAGCGLSACEVACADAGLCTALLCAFHASLKQSCEQK